MIKKINEAVAYIGTDDVDLDLFESQYEVPEGMAYNSYLIQDEKVAIMDTVDARCAQAWKENLVEALGDRTPDYLVVHHLEPDHTGLIDWVTRQYPALQVVASTRALQMMGQFFDGLDLAGRSLAVKEGDTLSLGSRSLVFYGAPMVHWPEVMVSWLDADRILFSADAFGKFGALSKCGYFSEEDGDWACEARRYYFNICGKYGIQVQALLKKVLPLPLDTICPLHGPVLRGDLAPYTGLYDTWSRYGVETEGVFVAYASIHGGTAAAALKMADILRAKGCPKVAVADLSRDDQAAETARRPDRERFLGTLRRPGDARAAVGHERDGDRGADGYPAQPDERQRPGGPGGPCGCDSCLIIVLYDPDLLQKLQHHQEVHRGDFAAAHAERIRIRAAFPDCIGPGEQCFAGPEIPCLPEPGHRIPGRPVGQRHAGVLPFPVLPAEQERLRYLPGLQGLYGAPHLERLFLPPAQGG